MIEIRENGEVGKFKGTYLELASDITMALYTVLSRISAKIGYGEGEYLQHILTTLYDVLEEDPRVRTEIFNGIADTFLDLGKREIGRPQEEEGVTS